MKYKILNEACYLGQVTGFLSSWSYAYHIGGNYGFTPAYVFNGDEVSTAMHTHPYRAEMVPVGEVKFCGYWREVGENIEPVSIDEVEAEIARYPRASDRLVRLMNEYGIDGNEALDWVQTARQFA